VQSVGGVCLVVGDRLYFYASGRTGRRNTVGLAFLRRDGFASMDAGPEEGKLTTRPVRFSGKHLFVNVDDPRGELRVEVLNQAGEIVAPFSSGACVPVTRDQTSQIVRWKDVKDLSSLVNQPVRFRFHLKNGRLYAFWVSPEPSGPSRGYVAAGGPGFTSNRDLGSVAGRFVLPATAQTAFSNSPPSAAPAKGPLRVHPENPRYFTDGTKAPDGSLKAVYLTGSHHWDNLQDGYNPEVTPFDYARYLDLLQKHHHNFIRLWAWEHVAAQRSWHYEHKPQRFDPMPYERTGPGLALDGRPKLDLGKLNGAYFERLRRRVQMAHDRGIYVGIMLFQGVAGTGPATWPGHVFNKNNNVNGIEGNGTDCQTLKSAAVTEIQKAYIRKVIDTVTRIIRTTTFKGSTAT